MIVADTNLFVYLLIHGEFTSPAEAVLRRDGEWAAPRLWRSEFRNVLATYMRRGLMKLEGALAAYERAVELARGREFDVDAARVLQLAADTGCAAYDCEFAALAEELRVPLVSFDGRMVAAFPGLAVSGVAFAARQ